MKKILMCRPAKFDVNYIINPWMVGNVDKVDKVKALEQWQTLHDTLVGYGAEMILTDEQPDDCPDAVFTANAGVALDGCFITSRFMHEERQAEEPFFKVQAEKLGLIEAQINTHLKFEGAGDALFNYKKDVLWMGWGFRTNLGFSDFLRDELNVYVCAVKLVDPRWYHLDTAFCPLDDGGALWYPGAFHPDSQLQIKTFYRDKLITVSEEDALKFACNAVSLGKTIVLPQVSMDLRLELANRGYVVSMVDMSQFLRSGGACKCLTLELVTT